MALQYLDETYAFVRGEIIFPSGGRASLWIEIRWESCEGRHFTFTVERFPGSSESEILGIHHFECANDCDKGWDGRHLIGVYDGIHANLYNGDISLVRSGMNVTAKVHGIIGDSLSDIQKGHGCSIEFTESIPIVPG